MVGGDMKQVFTKGVQALVKVGTTVAVAGAMADKYQGYVLPEFKFQVPTDLPPPLPKDLANSIEKPFIDAGKELDRLQQLDAATTLLENREMNVRSGGIQKFLFGDKAGAVAGKTFMSPVTSVIGKATKVSAVIDGFMEGMESGKKGTTDNFFSIATDAGKSALSSVASDVATAVDQVRQENYGMAALHATSAIASALTIPQDTMRTAGSKSIGQAVGYAQSEEFASKVGQASQSIKDGNEFLKNRAASLGEALGSYGVEVMNSGEMIGFAASTPAKAPDLTRSKSV